MNTSGFTGVPLNGNPRSPQINFVHYRIVRAGTTTYSLYFDLAG